ncbi:MAG: aldo/keto reductase [Eubacteriales bacterium]|nr:aldo/keto reductase [Eubacteriales bacterium]
MKNLGFGMMRLPVKNGNAQDFDYEELNKMVDTFLEAGYTYFDTSFVYHEGHSEDAVREALVKRHPRDSYTIADKFPTFNNVPEEEADGLFESQLKKVGVDYFDYYLMHNVQTVLYDGIDGNGGVIKKTRLFEHMKKWKEEGKIRHIGISFHSSADLLDRVLTEHPEIEFVQIPLNPVDWGSEFVQAGKCYDVIRRHGRKVIVMETVKGGGLSYLPAEAEKILKDLHPDWSIASWSVRFALGLPDVIAVLSGMSNEEQMQDNIHASDDAKALTEEEKKALRRAMEIYRENKPIPQSQIDTYKGLTWNHVPVTGILQAYSICQIQPNPAFSDDNNYFKNVLAEKAHLDLFGDLPEQEVRTADGEDITYLVEKAVRWLKKHSF